jgi:hypothetical protein
MSHFGLLVVLPSKTVKKAQIEASISKILAPYSSKIPVGVTPEKHQELGHVRVSVEEVNKRLCEDADAIREKGIPILVTNSQHLQYGDGIPQDGEWGFWENPEFRWDWYVIGGRWAGRLPMKEQFSAQSRRGELSWCNENSNPYQDNRGDFARINEIDWEQFDPSCFFAVLDADGWHAPGRIGAFANCTATPEEEDVFCKEIKEKFIDSKNPDSVIVAVDCHVSFF